MADYYVYLISSLPMLPFGAKPPFSFERFLEKCQGLIPDEETDLLKALGETGVPGYRGSQPTLRRWSVFDTALRNELVRIRASRRHSDPFRYLRQDGYTEPWIAHMATNAHRNPSILDAEKALDQERWRLLDELECGHYFDLDFLLVYGLKLLILERWERIAGADKASLLEEALQKQAP